MSWFSRSFSASFRSKEGSQGKLDDRANDDEDDEEQRNPGYSSGAPGKGVKEDFSELKKTFTRQLWGVASFLAPPPQTHVEGLCETTTSSDACPISGCGSHPEGHTHLSANPVLTGEQFLFNETVEVESQTSQEQATPLYQGAMADLSKPHRSSEHRLTGIRTDLAELKGSVATGLSRIMKVMREEIERDEVQQLADDSFSIPEDDLSQDGDESGSSSNPRQLPGINSLLMPLFGNILSADTGPGVNRDGSQEKEDEDDSGELSHQISRPREGRRAITLPSKLVVGLDGISKLASSLFPLSLDSDEEDSDRSGKSRQAVGVTDEVLAFARNISMHPETWLDFPLFSDDEDDDDFEMSNAQKEHVTAVELASPTLAALRIELCPDYMSEGRFWKIYFVLLHSRLSKKDAVLLSTPQIVEARALLLRELQKSELHGRRIMSSENREPNSTSGLQEQDSCTANSVSEKTSGTAESFKIVSLQAATEVPSNDFQQNEDLRVAAHEKSSHKSNPTNDIGDEIQNKNILASTVKFAALRYEEEEAEVDEWLDEEPSSGIVSSAGLGNEEDVSFSDLEEDDESSMRFVPSKTVESSISKRSHGWVQLNKNQTPEESDGLSHPNRNKVEGAGNVSSGKSGSLRVLGSEPVEQVTKKPERGESSDWLTVDEDDVASADFP